MALAIDHRVQLEDIAQKAGAEPRSASRLQGAGREGRGAGRRRPRRLRHADRREAFGREAMFEFARHPFSWLGRPVELPGSRPLRFEFSQDIGSQLVEWPVEHCIKCLCFYHPDDPAELKAEQQQKLRALFEAARKVGRELLVEIIAGKNGQARRQTPSRARWRSSMRSASSRTGGSSSRRPRRPPGSRSRRRSRRTIHGAAASCCSGWRRRSTNSKQAFAATANAPIVKGFAVGRTIFTRRPSVARRTNRRRGGDRRHGRPLREADRGLACRARPEGGIELVDFGKRAKRWFEKRSGLLVVRGTGEPRSCEAY